MDIQALKDNVSTTPAFVVDEAEISNALNQLQKLREASGCKVLYSIKSLSLSSVLALVKPHVDGFSTSSLFESKLAHEILSGTGSIHLTTPGIRPDEIDELSRLCTHISFNSFNQQQRFAPICRGRASVGLRVNPKLSFVKDERYNPCRQHSKLGVDIDSLWLSGNIDELQGLHLHTMFGGADYAPLIQTMSKLSGYLSDKLARLDWLNLGGGYLFHQIANQQPFIDLVTQLKSRFDLEVYIEPGNAVVKSAGYLVASVIDVFVSDGKSLAILDTSVNHNPEVFEYTVQPELHEHNAKGKYAVILAGGTCLAGDIFGEYRFNEPLAIGDKVVFKNVGAYSLVKASRFNGQNLPNVYMHRSGQLKLVKQFAYQDFRRAWWADD